MFGNNGREFVILLPTICKSEQMSLHYLNMDCRCQNSFLVFCQLLVLSERIVVRFQGHVTCHLNPGVIS